MFHVKQYAGPLREIRFDDLTVSLYLRGHAPL